uniref:Activator of basal transcription 1 n=1 Tax=Ixodes ricinus TaxID=34613 RepID=A0A0K8R818_IXORI
MAEATDDADATEGPATCEIAAPGDQNKDETASLATTNVSTSKRPKPKKKIPGVVYLSYIPPKMNVKTVRSMLSKFGELGRIFLQPEKPNAKKARSFTEGWVEFADKKDAKCVANALNGTQVGGKRRADYYYSLWSIKYLHRFRWTHLNERLAYEKAVREQRLRTEIAQAKRESNFYIASVEKSKRMRREAKGKSDQAEPEEASIDIRQRPTDQQIVAKRARKGNDAERTGNSGADLSLLKNIFVSSASFEDDAKN